MMNAGGKISRIVSELGATPMIHRVSASKW